MTTCYDVTKAPYLDHMITAYEHLRKDCEMWLKALEQRLRSVH